MWEVSQLQLLRLGLSLLRFDLVLRIRSTCVCVLCMIFREREKEKNTYGITAVTLLAEDLLNVDTINRSSINASFTDPLLYRHTGCITYTFFPLTLSFSLTRISSSENFETSTSARFVPRICILVSYECYHLFFFQTHTQNFKNKKKSTFATDLARSLETEPDTIIIVRIL